MEGQEEEWIGKEGRFCEYCALEGCCCHMVKLDEKIRQLKEEEDRKRHESNPGPDQGNTPGLGNFYTKRAYHEILFEESSAPSKAGPRMADLGGVECLRKTRIRRERRGSQRG